MSASRPAEGWGSILDAAYISTISALAGSVIGGLVGARVGRRLSPKVLRGVIVVVGIVAIVRLLA